MELRPNFEFKLTSSAELILYTQDININTIVMSPLKCSDALLVYIFLLKEMLLIKSHLFNTFFLVKCWDIIFLQNSFISKHFRVAMLISAAQIQDKNRICCHSGLWLRLWLTFRLNINKIFRYILSKLSHLFHAFRVNLALKLSWRI